VQLAAAAEAFSVGLDQDQAHAPGAGRGVGLADHHDHVALKPLLMKVLLPLMTHSSPSRTAVVRQALTSEPPPGSVMATARMVLPAQMSGSQRCFCSSVPRRAM
jgi:hypothetical protein